MMYKFNTELDIYECSHRLKTSITLNRSLPNRLFIPASGELFGKAKNNKFWLQKTDMYYIFNPTRVFYGKMSSNENGTTIQGDFRSAISEIIIESFIFAFIVIACGIITYAYISGNTDNTVALIIPYVILLSLIIIKKIKSNKRKTYEKYVLHFVKEIFNSN